MIFSPSRAALLAGIGLVLGACAAPTGAQSDDAPRTSLTSEAWPVLSAETTDPSFDPEAITALEAHVQAYVGNGDIPGIATLLVHDGEVISHVEAGLRRKADGAPITEDTIYRIYSMTKPVTAVAMMILVEEGVISLDAPVTNYLPELSNLSVLIGQTCETLDEEGAEPVCSPVLEPVSSTPTVRQLMSQTAGFAYGLSGEDYANSQFRERGVLSSPDLDTLVERVAGIPLISQPGQQWYYSISVDLQGAIIERVSGMSFGDFLDSRIFTPLGMDDTGFFVPAEDYDRFSDVFSYDSYAGQLMPMSEDWIKFTKDSIAFESGGGGLVSTLGDYARFCQMLLDGGALADVRVISEESVALMTRNQLAPGQGVGDDGGPGDGADGMVFGLGVGVFIDPATQLYGEGTHFWGGAAGTWYWIDPENDLFFIGMIQRFGAGAPEVDFMGETSALVYGALEARDE